MRPKGFGIADALLLCALALLIGFFFHSLLYRFAYDWNWASVPQFLLAHGENGWEAGVLGKGLITTIRLAAWSSLGAVLIGIVWALGRRSANPYIALLARTAIECSRNLPPLVLVFVFYYFLSSQLIPWEALISRLEALPPALRGLVAWLLAPPDRLDVFLPAVFTLSLYEGAYMAEIFRGGLEAIPRGQWEASYCLGLSRCQRYIHVIGPQVVRKVLPQMSGQCISTVKESAIVAVIGIEELTYSGLQLMATIKHPFEVWLTVTGLYMLLTLTISCVFNKAHEGGKGR